MSDNQPDENKSREIENQFFQGAKLQIIGGAALVVAGLTLIASARAVLDAFSKFLRIFIPQPTDPNEATYWPIGLKSEDDSIPETAAAASSGVSSFANATSCAAVPESEVTNLNRGKNVRIKIRFNDDIPNGRNIRFPVTIEEIIGADGQPIVDFTKVIQGYKASDYANMRLKLTNPPHPKTRKFVIPIDSQGPKARICLCVRAHGHVNCIKIDVNQ